MIAVRKKIYDHKRNKYILVGPKPKIRVREEVHDEIVDKGQDIAEVIYELMQKPKRPFVFYKAISRPIQKRMMIAYGGIETRVYMSDPEHKIKGAATIYRKSVVYCHKAPTLHKICTYIYNYMPPECTFFIDAGFIAVLSRLRDAGYRLKLSEDLESYRKEVRFSAKERCTIERIMELNHARVSGQSPSYRPSH